MEQSNQPTLEQLQQSLSTFRFIYHVFTQRLQFYAEEFQSAHTAISTLLELVKSLQQQIDNFEKIKELQEQCNEGLILKSERDEKILEIMNRTSSTNKVVS